MTELLIYFGKVSWPLPFLAHHQLHLHLLTLLPLYFFMVGSLPFAWFIQASSSSSLSSPSETAWDPATAYYPCCSVTSSRPFLPLILVTYLDMFYLCPLMPQFSMYSPSSQSSILNHSSSLKWEGDAACWECSVCYNVIMFCGSFSREPFVFSRTEQLDAGSVFLPFAQHLTL